MKWLSERHYAQYKSCLCTGPTFGWFVLLSMSSEWVEGSSPLETNCDKRWLSQWEIAGSRKNTFLFLEKYLFLHIKKKDTNEWICLDEGTLVCLKYEWAFMANGSTQGRRMTRIVSSIFYKSRQMQLVKDNQKEGEGEERDTKIVLILDWGQTRYSLGLFLPSTNYFNRLQFCSMSLRNITNQDWVHFLLYAWARKPIPSDNIWPKWLPRSSKAETQMIRHKLKYRKIATLVSSSLSRARGMCRWMWRLLTLFWRTKYQEGRDMQ